MIRREPGVVKRSAGPSRCSVASLATSGEPCGRVVWIARAVIVGLVARIAVGRHRGVVTVYMTAGAGNGGMRPGQGKRCVVVIEGRRAPCGRGVA